MAFTLLVEGLDPKTRHEVDEALEPLGHGMRADVDPAYKKATWGLRPEDYEAQSALFQDLTGQRTR